MLKIYQYEKCDTCRKALKFLDQRKVAYEKLSIVTSPPSRQELQQMLAYVSGDIRKLFNTSGQMYREMKLSEKLPAMTEKECLDLLASQGMLIKRPFILAPRGGTVGFREDNLEKLL